MEATAVADLFYPADVKELSGMIDGFLKKADPEPVPGIRGLVCPHAGYQYSGLTAAFAYKQLVGSSPKTVIVMAPSHYSAFMGAALPNADVIRTRLGDIPVSPKVRELAGRKPFAVDPPSDVHRPNWWRMSLKKAPPDGQDTPFTWEHSLEVQLPFLQSVLKDFSVVPIIFGQVDPDAVAKGLAPIIDESTVIIASSDLSHFHPYNEAKRLDSSCVDAICTLDIGRMKHEEACGQVPVTVLMQLAVRKGWKTKLLDYRNSGDTAGDKSGVVGYAAIAFYEAKEASDMKSPEDPPSKTTTYNERERKLLLEIARKSIVSSVTKKTLPEIESATMPARLMEPRGCFVTLTEKGELRGCIGHLVPREPLYQAVVDNARSAALEDMRFPPVRASEIDRLHIEISVLTVPQKLDFASPQDLLNKLRPGIDGVVLSSGPLQATYLPQVWEQLPDKESFLTHLSQKAGGSPWLWKSPGTEIRLYQAEAFEEPE